MSDAIELLDDIEKYYGSLNDVPECVVKYIDYLSSMICNETKVSRLSILTELEQEVEERIEKNGYRSFSMRYAECKYFLSLIRSKKGGA